jgi:hypothetical protein
MVKQILLVVSIYLTIGPNFYCVEKNNKISTSNPTPRSLIEDADSITHLNGKKLFGLYCLACHRPSKNPLLGNSENISLDNFFFHVLKDSSINSTYKRKNKHPKFEGLTIKYISDIKLFLDKV